MAIDMFFFVYMCRRCDWKSIIFFFLISDNFSPFFGFYDSGLKSSGNWLINVLIYSYSL